MPEDIFLMILRIIDLCVVFDRCALHHVPLLRDYDPGFSPSLFEPLLLPTKAQMGRLYQIEQYLMERTKVVKPNIPSIFVSNHVRSFAVRYFGQYKHHRELQREIEMEATSERSEKIAELTRKRRMFEELVSKAERLKC